MQIRRLKIAFIHDFIIGVVVVATGMVVYYWQPKKSYNP